MIIWTEEDQMIAHGSGWGIFRNSDHGIQIERLDDPMSVGLSDEPLRNDDEARALVIEAARNGDLHAQKALAYIKQERRYGVTNDY